MNPSQISGHEVRAWRGFLHLPAICLPLSLVDVSTNGHFFLFSVSIFFFSFDPSDFLPTMPHGCWNISSQVNAGIFGDAAPHLNDGQSNPGKCAAYCYLFPTTYGSLGALTGGGTCYCIRNFRTDGSSNACTSTCGKDKKLWPGYLCGSATDKSIVNVYEWIERK